MNNFFEDKDYQVPSTSNYMKFAEGENTFRTLSSAITGYVYFTNENKPVRSKHPFDETPNIKQVKSKNGEMQDDEVKHFWAFCVWNYREKRVQILEITQKGIMMFMQGLVNNPRWGNPQGYDITINRTGNGLNTEYTYRPEPHSVLEDHIAEAWSKSNIDLSELYVGGDPFKPTKKFEMPKVSVDTGEVPDNQLPTDLK